MMKKTIIFTIASLFIFLPLALQAQRKKVIYRKKTKIEFSDKLIEGKENNPEGVYVVVPKDRKFKNLLRLRKNFHRELIRDALLFK